MSKRSGVGVVLVVAVGGSAQADHGAAGRHGRAVQLDVAGDVPGHVGRRGLEAEELLDGVGHEGAVLHQLAALVGVLGEHLPRPADEAVGGLVPCARQHAHVEEHLVAGEPARWCRSRPRARRRAARSSGRRTGARRASRCTRRRSRPARCSPPPPPSACRARCAVTHRLGGGPPPGAPRGCRAACRSFAWASVPPGRPRSRSARRPPAGRGTGRRSRAPSTRARSSSWA